MRHVVIGNYASTLTYMREHRLLPRKVIPVPAAGPVGQALAGLNPDEVTIVLVHGSDRWIDAQALAHIERFRALGAQFLVME